MPDERFLHKRLGHSKKVNALNDLEFRVWAQYQLSADDCGVMRNSAITIQADNDSLADRPAKAIQKALDKIVAVGLLHLFEHQGRQYVCQLDWNAFQKVRFPRATVHPAPPAELLAKCCSDTRKLFQIRHGGSTEPVPNDSGETSELPPVPTRVGGREEANANGLRQKANGSSSSQPTISNVEPVRPVARTTGGVMAGSLPRDHINCRPPCVRVCLSQKQHAVLAARYSGDRDKADADLDAFYAEVRSKLNPDEPIGQRPWEFWEQQYAARFASSVVPQGKTAGNFAAAARFVARGQS